MGPQGTTHSAIALGFPTNGRFNLGFEQSLGSAAPALVGKPAGGMPRRSGGSAQEIPNGQRAFGACPGDKGNSAADQNADFRGSENTESEEPPKTPKHRACAKKTRQSSHRDPTRHHPSSAPSSATRGRFWKAEAGERRHEASAKAAAVYRTVIWRPAPPQAGRHSNGTHSDGNWMGGEGQSPLRLEPRRWRHGGLHVNSSRAQI